MRCKPGENKWNAFPLSDGKLGHGFQVFAVCFDWRAKNQGVGAGHCLEATVTPPHPWNDRSVVESYDQFHSDGNGAAQAFDDSDNVGVRPTRRHKIDVTHDPLIRIELGFEDKGVVTISAFPLRDPGTRSKRPAPILLPPNNAAKHAPESNRGKQSQSTQPSRLISAPL